MIAFSGQKLMPFLKQLTLFVLHPLDGSQYSPSEQRHRSSHSRPKYPDVQVNEQFLPMYPGLQSKRDNKGVLILSLVLFIYNL